MPALSIVVPCFNEEACLGALHERLTNAAREAVGEDYELVLVNDGSRDGSWAIMQGLAGDDSHLLAVNLSRNHGHQLALTAGLDLCTGDTILIIDADLQDPPELLTPMLETMRETGADVVYGVRKSRRGETAFKRATAHGFYRLLSRATEVDIPLDAGDFRLMDRRVVNALQAMPERDRFVRGMVAWVGFRQIAVPYERAPRFAGESKYPLFKMLRFALDGVTSFSAAPLHLATWTGFAASALAMIGVVYALVLRLFTSNWVTGWTALFIAVLFVGGTQLLALGVIGEYIGRIYAESKRRPLYVVQERLGFDRPEHAEQVPLHIYREPELARRDVRVTQVGRRSVWPDDRREGPSAGLPPA